MTLFNLADYHSMIPCKKVLKRGNPNFKPSYSDKSVVIRVPSYLKDKIKQIALDLDNGSTVDLFSLDSSDRINELTLDRDNLLERINQLQDQIAYLASNNSQNTVTQSGSVCEIPVNQIKVDPYRFQFKLIHNGQSGSTGSLKGVKTWNPDLAGILLVWLDPLDGLTYVIDGHNRLDRAVSLGVNSIAVRYINAPNAAAARLIGAMSNVANGKGNALDAAKIFRDSGLTQDDLVNYGITLKDSLAKDGLNLSNLENWIFEKVYTGKLDIKIGVAIGSVNKELQKELHDLILKDKRSLTKAILDELVNLVKSSQSDQGSLFDLFGNSVTQSNAVQKSELIAYIKQRLTTEKTLLSKVSKSKNKQILESANSSIDSVTASSRADQSDSVLRLFEQLKLESGDVSYWLNYYADKLLNATNKTNIDSIKNDAYDRIWAVLNVDNILDLVG